MHAFTGCDTLSAFAGKAQALKILKNNTRSREALTELGKEWDLPPKLTQKFEEHGNMVTTKVNELRYQPFCLRRGEIESHQLPPCRDCLVKLAKLACLEQDPLVPTAVGRGWKI